ncbi:hypothetical protein KEG38_51040 [Polyangium jinanense]|uniref:Galactose oxidase n=2 Tax=Polyangium jinanense TaxID=2829994 RepID=A0A9X3XEL6_9BACT|nr:hypothetical protein [Polyangium jinanense]MDC3988949.1 hypothetical protein [Polyangium jinanense]
MTHLFLPLRGSMRRRCAGLAATLAMAACSAQDPTSLEASSPEALSVATCVGLTTAPQWEAVPQHGDVPTALWEAGISFARSNDPDIVYRFGGQIGAFPTDFTVNDFYSLDLSTMTWTNLGSPETPAPRADTLMIPGPCGNCVSIVGGRGRFRTGSDHMFPEMWTYHTKSRQWELAPQEEQGDPFAMRRSSAAVVGVPAIGHPKKKTFYAFGGVGNTLPRFATTPTGLRDDLAIYDEEAGWQIVPTYGEKPAPRAWPAGAYDPATHSLLIFGGYRLGADQGPDTPPGELFGPTNYENDLWSLSLDTFTWTQLHPEGDLPSPRDNAVVFFDTAHGGLVVFGGSGFDRVSNDLWFYSMAENRWTEMTLDPIAPIPPARVGGVSFVRETQAAFELFLHGGSSSDGGSSSFFDDLWKLTWSKR